MCLEDDPVQQVILTPKAAGQTLDIMKMIMNHVCRPILCPIGRNTSIELSYEGKSPASSER